MPTKSNILKCGTAASGFSSDGQNPIIEMDMADTVAVLRFAQASIMDLVTQVNKARTDKSLKKYEFNDIVAVAETICNWLNNVVNECEFGIKQMKANETTILGA